MHMHWKDIRSRTQIHRLWGDNMQTGGTQNVKYLVRKYLRANLKHSTQLISSSPQQLGVWLAAKKRVR